MEDTKELEIAYEIDYYLEDPAFWEPLAIMKSVNEGLPSWWGDRSKVENLIRGFKMDFTVHEACILAGISKGQYTYFCKVHPHFLGQKDRLKGVLAIAAKQGLVTDIQHPQGFRSRQWYLERKQPKLYGRAPELTLPPDTNTMTTLIQRAFSDKTGKIIVTEATASVVKKHEDNRDND